MHLVREEKNMNQTFSVEVLNNSDFEENRLPVSTFVVGTTIADVRRTLAMLNAAIPDNYHPYINGIVAQDTCAPDSGSTVVWRERAKDRG